MAIRKNLMQLRVDTLLNKKLFPKDRQYKYVAGILEEIKKLEPEDIDGLISVAFSDTGNSVEILLTAAYAPDVMALEIPEDGILSFEQAYRDQCSVITKMQDDEEDPKPIPIDGKWMCPECETVSAGDELEIDLDGCRSCPECGYVLFTPEEWRDMTC